MQTSSNRCSGTLMLLAMAACGGDTDTDSGGAIEVVTQTNGTNMDPDGYRVVVDEASQAMSIGVDDTVLFQGQTSGSHFVAPNTLDVRFDPCSFTVDPRS